ncbi:MAG: hypothetical protein VX613_05590 [Candidatus Thermoplasmatota archaeon]|nr:hypothetical protein [Candidatus Thermoplasmatota archaeon]|tara:strand:- start:3382 stop:4020 length:639 start_codon:yes stop_codon:yes gene_type:complete
MDDEIYSSRDSFENALQKAKQEARWNDAGGYLRHACLLYPDLVDDIHNILLEAAQYYERGGNIVEQAWCYHDLGSWYLEETKGEVAVTWLEKSKRLFQELGNTPGAKEGLKSTKSELKRVRSEKPFLPKKSGSIKGDIFSVQRENLIRANGDPTDMPAILMTLGAILALMSIIPTYITLNFFGIAAFFSLCSGGLIIFMVGLIRFIKIKFKK